MVGKRALDPLAPRVLIRSFFWPVFLAELTEVSYRFYVYLYGTPGSTWGYSYSTPTGLLNPLFYMLIFEKHLIRMKVFVKTLENVVKQPRRG
jgi:hypothetical protein